MSIISGTRSKSATLALFTLESASNKTVTLQLPNYCTVPYQRHDQANSSDEAVQLDTGQCLGAVQAFLASYPGPFFFRVGEGEKMGLVHIVCACAIRNCSAVKRQSIKPGMESGMESGIWNGSNKL